MQGLSSKGLERDSRLGAEMTGLGLEAGAVNIVAEQRMADRGQMDPDLVGAAGFEPAGEQARDRCAVGPGIALEHFPDRPIGVVVTGVKPGHELDYGYYSYAYAGH